MNLLPLCLWCVLASSVAPAVTAPAPFQEDAEVVAFELRSEFVATPVEAEMIRAECQGAAADDIYALPIQALGDVDSKRVADIGAGRGRHLAGIARAVGPEGRLVATEVDEASCADLKTVAEEAGLANVTVALADKNDVGLEPASLDIALLSDVYQFVDLLDGRSGQDKHAFLTSLEHALCPGGEVVVTYVTFDHLKRDGDRAKLYERTLSDFVQYGFEPGRRWILEGPYWPVLVFEFRKPLKGPALPRTYLGRSIARTMHWQGAGWLVRDERAQEEQSQNMLAALDVRAGQTVADYGCGNGYHTLELAESVGPEGKVYGVDIQPEMLTMLTERAEARGLANVVPIPGGTLDAPLPPASCDLILLADVYHELSHPVPILAVLRRSLKPGGRVAALEFRAEDPDVPIKPEHKMSHEQVVKEFEANGFVLDGSFDELPWQHLLFFRLAE